MNSMCNGSRDELQMVVIEFLPFFSIRHGPHGADDGCFWYAQRKPSLRRADDGSEMSITLVARDMNPRGPSVDTLSIGLTCTNRHLLAALPYRGDAGMLTVAGGGAFEQARLLKKPTATWRTPLSPTKQVGLPSPLFPTPPP